MKINSAKIELISATRGLNAKELAEKSGVCRQTLSTLKTRGTCRPMTLIRLARALGVDPTEIMEVNE